MKYTAKDGKTFPNAIQGRKYDESIGGLKRDSLSDLAKARGGPSHSDDLAQHGFVKKVSIIREGNGRHKVEAVHQDGFKHQSVHPEAYRAHDIARELLGIEPPPALGTHSKARTQPRGPKEDERVAKEDSRTVDSEDDR